MIFIFPSFKFSGGEECFKWRFSSRLGELPAQDPSQSLSKAESGSLVFMLIRAQMRVHIPNTEPLLYMQAAHVKSVKTRAVCSHSLRTEVGEGESRKLL